MHFRTFRHLVLSIFLCTCFLGCGADSESKPNAAKSPSATGKAEEASKPEPKPVPPRREPALPGMEGRTLEGEAFSLTNYIGKRVLIYFFDAGEAAAVAGAEAIRSIAALQHKNNFQLIGVSTGDNPMQTSGFVGKYQLNFPIVVDSNKVFLQRFRLRESNAIIGMDPEGYFSFIHGVPHDGKNPAQVLEGQLRESLRLPSGAGSATQEMGEFPDAPDFTATVLDGDEQHTLSAYRGKPVIVMFFMHTCPHCHKALAFFKQALPKFPEESRPVLLGIEISGKHAAAQERLNKDGFDFFPALADPGRKILSAYNSMGSVPDIYLISSEGKIVNHSQGWRELRDPPLFQIRLSLLAGVKAPILLNKQGYSGNEFCVDCHQDEARTWEFTKHAGAFDSLVKHGDDHDPECVSCHVVGNGEPGGFLLNTGTTYLEDVGCESCHGPGGGHIDDDFVEDDEFEDICKTCHNTKHSLGFDYATFLPQISHEENAELLTLSAEERDKLLAERGLERKSLLNSSAAFTGSESCKECHEEEYATWSKGPHVQAVQSLIAKGKGEENKSECLACHTTGYGKTGGFPENAPVADHPDLAKVGCESCHGPGGEHVAEEPEDVGPILSLGDKCDSCVILSICGSCHDDANDPEFEFNVQEKIDKIRHGTIEPKAGLPDQDKSAARPELSTSSIVGLLEQGFSALP